MADFKYEVIEKCGILSESPKRWTKGRIEDTKRYIKLNRFIIH